MKKDILAICVLALIVAVLIMGTDFQTVEEYYLTHAEDITEDSQTVFLSIDCLTALDKPMDSEVKKLIPDDGIILKKTEYVLREGDTVFDLLQRAVQKNKISMEYSGGQDSAYIEGIGYLYEFSCGELSGWMYSVNGKFPAKSCSSYKLKDGDSVQWRYTCDLGRDVGDDWSESDEK